MNVEVINNFVDTVCAPLATSSLMQSAADEVLDCLKDVQYVKAKFILEMALRRLRERAVVG